MSNFFNFQQTYKKITVLIANRFDVSRVWMKQRNDELANKFAQHGVSILQAHNQGRKTFNRNQTDLWSKDIKPSCLSVRVFYLSSTRELGTDLQNSA